MVSKKRSVFKTHSGDYYGVYKELFTFVSLESIHLESRSRYPRNEVFQLAIAD